MNVDVTPYGQACEALDKASELIVDAYNILYFKYRDDTRAATDAIDLAVDNVLSDLDRIRQTIRDFGIRHFEGAFAGGEAR